MSETPEQYRKRREGLHKAEERRAERQRKEALRLCSLSDEDILREHESNFLYGSNKVHRTRRAILARMKGIK